MSNKDYVLDKISSTKVSYWPWKHLIVENLIPKNLYNDILKEVELYKNVFEKKRTVKRGYTVEMNKSKNVYPAKPHLKEYYDILSDKDVELAIKEKVNLKDYHHNNLSVDMWSSFDIQTSGFVYDVHPDISPKIHTMVHYLAEEGDDTTLGTTLYSPEKDCDSKYYDNMGRRIRPFDTEKDYLKRAPYLPNTAIIFSPCRKEGFMSNHSMFNTSSKTKYRKTLQTFWLDKKVDWTGEVLSKKTANFITQDGKLKSYG